MLILLSLLVKSCNKNETIKPNVIFIIVDDLGYKDLGVYGSSFYETPNIDKLINDGVMFTNGYSNSSVCSPARASFQTGKYPVKTGITDWIKGRKHHKGATPNDRWIVPETAFELDLDETTIAEALKIKGYKTAYVGKWHLGEDEKYWPENQGYDINVAGWRAGSPNKQKNNNGYFSPYGNPKLTDGPIGEYLPDRLTDEALSILKNKADQPVFLCLSYYLVHAPFQAKQESIDFFKEKRQREALESNEEFLNSQPWMEVATGNPKRYKERIIQGHPTYAAMVHSLDENVGRLISSLKENKSYENSLIVFVSDNGGLSTSEGSPTSNLPLAKGKGWMYEGGLRVPFSIKPPFSNENFKTDMPVSGIDIFPTILAYAGENAINKQLDGINLAPYIRKHTKADERPIFWHYPHYSNQGGNPSSAVRLGDFKLIHDLETNKSELYNLNIDMEESTNLINDKPNISKKLKNILNNWLNENYNMTFNENPTWNGKQAIDQTKK